MYNYQRSWIFSPVVPRKAKLKRVEAWVSSAIKNGAKDDPNAELP
jgi:hypothetical protein